MRKLLYGIGAGLIFATLAQAQSTTVAVVGSNTITTAQLEKTMGTSSIDLQATETKTALKGLIEDEIIRQEAKLQGIVVDPKQIDQVVNIVKQRFPDEAGFEDALSKEGITLDDLKMRGQIVFQKVQLTARCVIPRVGITQQMFERFCEDYAVKVHARHILVATEEEAASLLKQIKEGADFATVAKEHSTCPSHVNGGDLGFFGCGQMVKEFEDTAFSLTKENPLSGVVKTQFGYHLIQFIDRAPAEKKKVEIENMDVRHILVKTEEEAASLLKQIKEGANFAELAGKHSTCPSRSKGGDLGFFGRGQMVKEFEDAAFSLTKENPLSGIVKTQFGYHILQFVDKKIETREESIEIDAVKKDLFGQLMGQGFIVAGEGLQIQILKPLEERFIGDSLRIAYDKWIEEAKKKLGVKVSVQ
ncbi:peptidylprolyl isomerase [Candidatus Desantisbacteria bacterium]|nr:peptidylprolyl isomerase [Candidatus Desantisbacteria bacterium]